MTLDWVWIREAASEVSSAVLGSANMESTVHVRAAVVVLGRAVKVLLFLETVVYFVRRLRALEALN